MNHVDRDSLLSSAPHGAKVFHTGEWLFDTSRTIARTTIMTVVGRRVHVDFNVRTNAPLIVDENGHLVHLDISLLGESLSSGSRRRDARLRSARFLDVDRYPTIGFVGRGENDLISGVLSLKGQPSSMTLVATNATLQMDGTVEFSVEGKIQPKSLGLGKLACLMVGQFASFQMCGVSYPA